MEGSTQPKMEKREPFLIVGMLYRGKNENQEIPQLWGDFGTKAQAIKHKLNMGVSYGARGNYEPGTGEFDYVAALRLDS